MTVVIPAWQEAKTLPQCLGLLQRQEPPFEVIVVDGGSADGTVEAARAIPGVRVVETPRGRARQMNHGARLAHGDYLWFLHADCAPAPGSVAAIRGALEDPRVSGGAFRFRLDGNRLSFRIIESGVALRTRWFGLPYGDQGLFLRRSDFEAIGGYRDVPVFEDVFLAREIRRRGRLVVLDIPLVTSARRWEADGVAVTTWAHWKMLALEKAGVGPMRLARMRGSRTRGLRPHETGPESRRTP